MTSSRAEFIKDSRLNPTQAFVQCQQTSAADNRGRSAQTCWWLQLCVIKYTKAVKLINKSTHDIKIKLLAPLPSGFQAAAAERADELLIVHQ